MTDHYTQGKKGTETFSVRRAIRGLKPIHGTQRVRTSDFESECISLNAQEEAAPAMDVQVVSRG